MIELEGIVGEWGLAQDEQALGLLIESIDEKAAGEKAWIRDNKGNRVGRSEYDESVEVSLAAEVLGGGAIDLKLGGVLSLANAVGLIGNLNGGEAGRLLVNDVGRGRNREEWEKVQVEAELLPMFPDPGAEVDGALSVAGDLLAVGGDVLVVV